MASKKSKVLAIAFCAAVMAGIHVNPVLAYLGDEDFNYKDSTTKSGLNNPEIHHTVDKGGYWDNNDTWWDLSDDEYVPDWQPVHPEGDVNCEEEVANSNITVGDMNKVTADLVANDEKIYSDVKDLQEQVDKIGTTADTDTHVKEGAATVDENGVVSIINIGTCIITATSEDGNHTATCTITVPYVKVEGIYFDNEEYEIGVGHTLQLEDETNIFPSHASNREVTYNISLGKDIISIDKNGLVTGFTAVRRNFTIK